MFKGIAGVCLGLLLLPLGACQGQAPQPAGISVDIAARLDQHVQAVVRQLAAAGWPSGADVPARFSSPLVRVDAQGRVAVILTLSVTPDAAVRRRLGELGMEVTATAPDGRSIQGWLPAAQVEAMAAQAFVAWIAPPGRMLSH
jgi:hypothetical protein